MSRHGDAASTGSSVSGAGGGRWDAERFMREHRDRRESSARRERRTAVDVLERDRGEKGGRAFVEEYLHHQETYGPPARQADRSYEDEHLLSSSDALIPFKERRRASPSPFRKPKLLRRQSSLDTFDRAATRLANEYHDRDDYGPPIVPVTAPRRRSPAVDSDWESIRVAEPDYYGDEVFRSMRERDRSVTPRGRYSREEPKEKERTYPRRGKTRIPKKLVHRRAVIDLGYPFEEEGDHIIILQALGKDNIDQLVGFSKRIREDARAAEIRERERHVSRPRSESVAVDTRRAQSRRRSPSVIRPHFELVDLRDVRQPRRPSPSPAPSAAPMVRTRRRRLSSPVRFIHPHPNYAHQVIQPNTDMTLLYPDRTRRQEIVIRPREEERKVVTVEPGVLAPGDAIEVKKNYKAPNPRLIRAMMATLT